MSATDINVFDVCVVGAGVEGSATARYLAFRGKKTLLLEQFNLPHSRGSSHGATRLVRYGYAESSLSNLMPEAFKMWAEIENMAGKQLIRKVGLLSAEGPPYGSISKLVNNVRNLGVECQVLTSEDIKRKYPMLNLPPDWNGTLEPSGGFIMANQAVGILQKQFVDLGGILRDGEKVLDVQPGNIVRIRTSKATHRANSIIITPGAWINEVLKPLSLRIPVEVWRVVLCYWRPENPNTYTSENGFPGFLFYDQDIDVTGHNHIYGFPVFEYPGLIKICHHSGVPISDPESRDDTTNNEKIIAAISDSISNYFTGISPVPKVVEPCMYTVTPDGMFVLDRHPQFNNIVIGAGFSGHGFKMAPVVGKILSQLALGEKPSHDLHDFSLARFNNVYPKASL